MRCSLTNLLDNALFIFDTHVLYWYIYGSKMERIFETDCLIVPLQKIGIYGRKNLVVANSRNATMHIKLKIILGRM